ncbi:MAG: hypothetical protein EPO21_20690 [Chloroflexota bacterium]|nr:MAG: hypothetical protein EPO21_20690 [Chloroflexota bacterium]
MDQTRLLPVRGQDGADAVLLAKGVCGADKLDLQAAVLGEPFSPSVEGPDLVAERFGEAGIVEQADILGAQVGGHPIGIASTGQRAHDDDAVVAGEHPTGLLGIALG